MSLGDLEKKIYDPESKIEERKHEESRFDPFHSDKTDGKKFPEEKKWEKIEDSNGEKRKKILKIALIIAGAVFALALLIWGFSKYRQTSFKEGNAVVKIEGPTEVRSAQEIKYIVSFKNKNRVELKNAQILLSYPESFQPVEGSNLKIDNPLNSRIVLGNLKSGAEGKIEIKGKFSAAKNSIIYLNATLQYTPSNFNSIFQSKFQLGVNVSSSPLFIEIEAPAEVASGSKVDYVVNYTNSSQESLDGVRIKVEYPQGFSFNSSTQSPSEGNNIWNLGGLQSGQNGKIVISGELQGQEEESEIFKAFVGSVGSTGEFVAYDQKEKITKITSTAISIAQSFVNKSDLNVNPGENLGYVISYENKGNIALRDVIITLEIDSRIVDFSKLNLEKGSFDASQKKISWRASEIPKLSNLAPGERGEIRFNISVLDRIPVSSPDDKNFTIVSTVKTSSPSISSSIGSNKTVVGNKIELKLNSRVVLDVKGYYQDSLIANSGPIPPQVGQETTYTIHWKILNVSNDIGNVRVSSFIPSGVKWKGLISPQQESVSYNERSNQIEWEVGSLKSGTGILVPQKEVAFQIGVVPQINQLGQELILLGPAVLTAKDLFTNSEIKLETKEKNNFLAEDQSIGANYKVTN